jgi:formate/nitrite transporter FocA (FNT family)
MYWREARCISGAEISIFSQANVSARLTEQGVQIGRIFAILAGLLFTLGIFLTYTRSQNCLATRCRRNVVVLNGTNYGLGFILGIFFARASGHPVTEASASNRRSYR